MRSTLKLLGRPSSLPKGYWTAEHHNCESGEFQFQFIQPCQLHQPHNLWERRQLFHHRAIIWETALQRSLNNVQWTNKYSCHSFMSWTTTMQVKTSEESPHKHFWLLSLWGSLADWTCWGSGCLAKAQRIGRGCSWAAGTLRPWNVLVHHLIRLCHYLASFPQDSRGGISSGFAQAREGCARFDTRSLESKNFMCHWWISYNQCQRW